MAAVIEAGSLIAGRYQLLTLIGEGGMASVWRAQDQTLKRMVAIKLLYVRGQRDPRAIVDQFLREARIAASVQHRNVIHTVDFGIADEQLPYMVMELLTGESLAQRMEREPKLTMEEVVHLASLTLRGLGAVHEVGIVHRDLKPQNIFLHRDSDTVYPKILDFGISRSLADDPGRPSAISTQDGMIVGTPDYMSPEQARGETDIDRRADIYSMGAILFEGITGRLPHEADTIGELIVKIVTTKAPTMREIRADVPQLLSDCVAQAMAHDREERFVDATVFRRALLRSAEEAFATDARRPLTSEAPPRRAPADSAPLAPLSLPKPPPPSAVPAMPAGGWGDFEGLGARSPDGPSATRAPPTAPSPPSAAHPVAGGSGKPPVIAPPVAAMKSSRSDVGTAAGGATASAARGDHPFDKLGGSLGPAAVLDIDYERNGAQADALPLRSPVQRAAVQHGRLAGGASRGAQQRAKSPAVAAAPARGRQRARPGGFAPWVLPLVLVVLLLAFVLAPGLASAPAPDERAARQLEARNPATAGSHRLLQTARRRDLRTRPPALRDVVF